MEISQQTARRFVLGRQGLWPGRRWRGVRGTEQAMRAMEHLQLDPLAMIARAQDLMLASRVIDYRIDDWAVLTYTRRRFFDWGGWLAVRPMDELPYWRTMMQRERSAGRWLDFEREHHAAIVEMRSVLGERGTVANRDFAMQTRVRTTSYRGRKDSALALYYLWRTGEAMVHHRERFERVYALTEVVAPRALIREAPDAEADDFMLRKHVASEGLTRFLGVSSILHRGAQPGEIRAWRESALVAGDLMEVRVEGWPQPLWALGSDAPDLAAIEAGRVPKKWKPLETSTTEEATFLAPLDPVSARGRAKPLFGFDYKWEVYTPAPQRKFGYYALPVLWGDRLVARFDAKFDRPTRTLQVLGLWLEDEALAVDADFAEALARGFERFLHFLAADGLDVVPVAQHALRRRLEAVSG